MDKLLIRSKAAIARLRAYKPPPFPLWDRLPLSRRAAVLILLYADRRGDLRVVLTMRAASLRSFSGHAAFPGGKADTLGETPYQTARREAWEEIGLPQDDAKIPRPFHIEHLCHLPFNLAKTELVVRPCVALLHASDPRPSSTGLDGQQQQQHPPQVAPSPSVEDSLIPILNAKEVAAVFSAPFHNFLRKTDEPALQRQSPPPPGRWYEGSWTHWHEEPWRMHFFYVPVANQRVTRPKNEGREGGPAAIGEHAHPGQGGGEEAGEGGGGGRFKVWGMTARMLVDAATVAYGEQPEFEHNSHFGDERMIEGLDRMGRLGEKRKDGSELTAEDLKEAAKM